MANQVKSEDDEDQGFRWQILKTAIPIEAVLIGGLVTTVGFAAWLLAQLSIWFFIVPAVITALLGGYVWKTQNFDDPPHQPRDE